MIARDEADDNFLPSSAQVDSSSCNLISMSRKVQQTLFARFVSKQTNLLLLLLLLLTIINYHSWRQQKKSVCIQEKKLHPALNGKTHFLLHFFSLYLRLIKKPFNSSSTRCAFRTLAACGCSCCLLLTQLSKRRSMEATSSSSSRRRRPLSLAALESLGHLLRAHTHTIHSLCTGKAASEQQVSRTRRASLTALFQPPSSLKLEWPSASSSSSYYSCSLFYNNRYN